MRKFFISIDIHRLLLNIYGDHTVDMKTIRRWLIRFSGGDNAMIDKARLTQLPTFESRRSKIL